MPFAKLGLSQPILRQLALEGYTTPTPIQSQAIPHILLGRDVLGIAQTGTGKTAAFALPLIHRLTVAPIDKSVRGAHKARVLVLSPTRELAAQIGESFATYGRESGLSHAVIFGGVSEFHQKRALRHGVDILVATPGRLIDLMQQGVADISGVETFVLDEADRMLDMGFIRPIQRIAAATPKTRQTLLFSATMPKEIVHLAHSLLKDPVKVAVAPVASLAPKIEQSLYLVQREFKQPLLRHLLQDAAMTRTLVFTKTKRGADRVSKKLSRAGVTAESIHGDKAQNQRIRALERFREGVARVLVATDVAARGLDVDGVSHVINYDLPMEPEAYVHRIGRTGRAGATGIAVSFCDSEERGLLRDIERLTGKKLPVTVTPPLEPEPRAEHSHDDRFTQRERPDRSRGSRPGHARPARPAHSRDGGEDRPAKDSHPRAANHKIAPEGRQNKPHAGPARVHAGDDAPRSRERTPHSPDRGGHAPSREQQPKHAKPAPWSKYVKRRGR